jgi:hypothetical protein
MTWPASRNNGVTEGYHNKLETTICQAYGFRSFENCRLRVKVLRAELGWDSGWVPRCGRRA